jgi:thioredoxin-related protein
MKIIFSILLILCGFALFMFKGFEMGLLNNGFSWTMSKLLPYLTLAIGGIFIAYTFAKGFKIKSKILKISIVVLLFVAPFSLGFAFNPIYEGDFSSNGTVVKESKVAIDPKYDLMVITIPGCPYCMESIGRLQLIKKRNPSVHILFSVCTSVKEDLNLYRELIHGDFDLAMAENPKESAGLAGHAFPTFVQLKKGLPTYKWSNDQFGAGAIDEFELGIK